MSDRDDEIANALRDLRPPFDDGYLDPGDDPAADALLSSLLERQPHARRRRRRRWLAGGIGGVMIVGAGTAAAVLLTREPDDPTVIGCYRDVEVDTADVFALPASSQLNAADQCAPLWENGTFGDTGAPPLTECVTDDGITAVLPGDTGVCQLVGWDAATPRSSLDSVPPATDLAARLIERFVDQCYDRDTATRVAEDVLEQLGLDDWSVVSDSGDTGRCFGPAVESDQRRVVLSPVP
ncbi:MAG: hypothetical protein QNJ12_18215 [Ilumatobacter sp.]|uniref:hypothetical protein n=1 Tax=Ilumatobacter sp. TaxID=1967498 RepID=UPI0026176C1D|nr:hypothetical protein [Ilumatobacter sp.]MDJ0770734.1 hypothetical protein [Ilumatobacter sp.]